MAARKSRSKVSTSTRKTSRKKARKSSAKTTRKKSASGKKKSAAAKKVRPAGAGRTTHDRTRPKSAEELPLTKLVEASPFALHDVDVEQALKDGDPRFRDHLEQMFGEALAAELGELARQASRAPTRGGPKVLILPGIMGSKLGFERWPIDDTIWVDPLDIAAGQLMRLAPGGRGKSVVALGVMLIAYLKLKLTLRMRRIDASFFPYDWRLDIRDLGDRLAKRLVEDGDARGTTLVAHSMGGLVARRALKVLEGQNRQDVVRRVVMLGTPNYGSYAPVLVLRKLHGLTRKLAALDRKHDLDQLVRRLFSKLVGLAELMPPPERAAGMDLFQASTWPGPWRPPQDVLSKASNLDDSLSSDKDRLVLIAGCDRPTIVGASAGEEGFTFRESRDGDGTVPLDLARMNGVTTYFARAEHGGMPNHSKVINAVEDLVKTGSTARLPDTLPAYAPSEREFDEAQAAKRAPEFGGRRGSEISASEVREILEGFVSAPRAVEFTLPTGTESDSADWTGLSRQTVEVARKRQRTLDIRAALGDITQVDARAIVLGVFAGVEPSGAANALDEQLDGAIRELVERGLLKGDVGQVFVLPAGRRRLMAELVVFVGLGQPDRFDDGVLHTVSRNVAHMLAHLKVDDFATVLIGGGSGDNAGTSLASMVGGFLEALRESDGNEHVRRVTVCERDRGRYDEAVSNLRLMLTSEVFDDVRATLSTEDLPAPMRQAERVRGERLDDPIYLMARQESEPRGGDIVEVLQLSLLTADGNATVLVGESEFDADELDRKLGRLDSLPNERTLDALGNWIAKEVLPRDVRDGLAASRGRHVVVVHDEATSRIPWESLRVGDEHPSIKGGVSRKLAANDLPASKWLVSRPVGERLKVLLVVDPTEDLPGARAEGQIVREALEAEGNIEVVAIEGPEATRARIRQELRTGLFDVLHYAGHAFYDVEQRERSGLWCHGDVVFSSGDMVGLEQLPALAVINACESGRVRQKKRVVGLSQGESGNATRKLRSADSVERVRLKASLAEAFLRGGIRGYVGTYWPVGDTAAKAFAKTFYHELIEGETISEALVKARKAVKRRRSIDWADYIHYGTRTLRLRDRA